MRRADPEVVKDWLKSAEKSVRSVKPLDVPPAECYAFGAFRLNSRTRELSHDGHAISLTPKAFDTLWILVTRADRIVEKSELMQLVWPDSFVGEDSLTQNIATLRKALGDSSDRPQYIATVSRRGYRFVALVQPLSARVDDSAGTEAGRLPAGAALDTAVDRPEERRRPSRRDRIGRAWSYAWIAATVVIFTTAAATLATSYFRRRAFRRDDGADDRAIRRASSRRNNLQRIRFAAGDVAERPSARVSRITAWRGDASLGPPARRT